MEKLLTNSTPRKILAEEKRVLVVVDVSNLYYCVAKTFNGAKLNYYDYLKLAVGNCKLYTAIAYGSELGNTALHFKAALREMGFQLKFKPPKIYRDPKNPDTEFRKSDWDVGIAVDIIRMIDDFDLLILGSADGDMTPCIQYIKEQGKECHVFACRISKDLRDTANSWTEITTELLE